MSIIWGSGHSPRAQRGFTLESIYFLQSLPVEDKAYYFKHFTMLNNPQETTENDEMSADDVENLRKEEAKLEEENDSYYQMLERLVEIENMMKLQSTFEEGQNSLYEVSDLKNKLEKAKQNNNEKQQHILSNNYIKILGSNDSKKSLYEKIIAAKIGFMKENLEVLTKVENKITAIEKIQIFSEQNMKPAVKVPSTLNKENASINPAQFFGTLTYYTFEQLKDDYKFHRDARPYKGFSKYLPGFAYTLAKKIGGHSKKAEIRSKQLNEISTLFASLENDKNFPTPLEKAKFAYNFLDVIQTEIKETERNSMGSGMIKLCDIIKSQIMGSINAGPEKESFPEQSTKYRKLAKFYREHPDVYKQDKKTSPNPK